MNDKNTQESVQVVAFDQTTQDFKHAVLIVSVLLNLGVFIGWLTIVLS